MFEPAEIADAQAVESALRDREPENAYRGMLNVEFQPGRNARTGFPDFNSRSDAYRHAGRDRHDADAEAHRLPLKVPRGDETRPGNQQRTGGTP